MSAETQTRDVSVRLYGAFRQIESSGMLTVRVADQATVAEVRRAVAAQLAGDGNALSLLKASAFATDEAVLEDESVSAGQTLSILPPVCGG